MRPTLAFRFFNKPITISADYAPALIAEMSRPRASIRAQSPGDNGDLYEIIENVALVPVRGVLVSGDTGWFDETSYDSIDLRMTMAANDPKVSAIAMHICSPGGEVDGCFELADKIYAMRGSKPIAAICDSYAYSAAYALASAADVICIPRTGGAGSVGVVTIHMEMSKMLEECGLGLTVIQYGAQKTERGPFAPLTPDAKRRMQDDVDAIGAIFVDLVARNRGLSTAAVRNTKAGIFLGGAALDNRLVDAVAAPQQAFAELVQRVNS